MRKLVAIAALAGFALLAASARATEAPQATPSRATCDSTLRERSAAADAHYRSQQFSEAAADVDAILDACGADPRMTSLRVARAELALRVGEYQRALDFLDAAALPSPEPGFVGWLRLQAHNHLGHADQVNQLTQTLLTASGEALVRGGMTRVETFEAGGYSVASYQGVFHNGPFVRYVEFLMRPLAGGMPVSIAISRDGFGLDDNSAEKTYFVDLNTCSYHATLEQFTARTAVSYAQARAAFDRFIAQQGAPMGAENGGNMCFLAQNITPGIIERR